MKNFFKKNIKTTLGYTILIVLAVFVLFIAVPLDKSSYNGGDLVFKERESVDVSKDGVHENASPDESCRLSDDGLEREILVDTFTAKGVDNFSGQSWVPESDIREVFVNLQSKLDVGCLYLKDRGIELFSQKKYKDDIWLDEGSVCISMSRFCGIPKL